MRKTPILVRTVVITMLVAAGAFPALAITNGTVDSVHANVGAVIFDQPSPAYFPGPRFQPWWCSGTLVSPRVFQTAGHCPLLAAQGGGYPPGGFPASKIHVSFATNILDSRSWLNVKSYVIDPDFLANGTPDVSVIFLKAPATGITPQPLPPAGFLDSLSPQQIREGTFTVVGYGMDQNLAVTGNRESGTAAYKSLYKSEFLILSRQPAGICFMDSGGPAFFSFGGEDYMVAAGEFVKRVVDCTGDFGEQRLDTPDALSFLQSMIGG